jgi:DNA-binding response OmpR family regulator
MKKKILVVEDDQFLQEFITKRLTEEGFKVWSAKEGQEGIEIALREKPDLIILDLILPGKSGYEVLEELKKNPQTSGTPVLILSNLGQKEKVEEALKKGASDFLLKAYFSLEEIILRVKLHLAKSKK